MQATRQVKETAQSQRLHTNPWKTHVGGCFPQGFHKAEGNIDADLRGQDENCKLNSKASEASQKANQQGCQHTKDWQIHAGGVYPAPFSKTEANIDEHLRGQGENCKLKQSESDPKSPGLRHLQDWKTHVGGVFPRHFHKPEKNIDEKLRGQGENCKLKKSEDNDTRDTAEKQAVRHTKDWQAPHPHPQAFCKPDKMIDAELRADPAQKARTPIKA